MRPDPTSSSTNLSRSRRDFFGGIALAWMHFRDGLAAEPFNPHATGSEPKHTSAPRPPHFPPRATSVIYLFMHGGPSHLDTFDPKPDLQRLAGRPLPESFGKVITSRDVQRNPLLATKRTFTRHGDSGIDVSDLLPHTATCVDELAVIRSCWADSVEHVQAVYGMNTGSIMTGKPCLGSWVGYGLGTENENLPAFVVLPQPGRGSNIKGGPQAYGAGFLPATFQATVFSGGRVAVRDLEPPASMSLERQRCTLDLIAKLNRNHLLGQGSDPDLEARIRSYELAARMQAAAPEAVDLAAESPATRRLYGVDNPITAEFGRRCLLARRLVERGVRFVQVFSGDVTGWDAHDNVETNHAAMCAATDRPVAALLRDLKGRGLLESTVVIWGGEFGRTPMSEGKGRDHNPYGFTVWMAGGGIKGGMVHGATDAVGLRAEVARVHVHDLHATILHLLGLDHTQLTYPYNGRDERLTGTAERVVRAILA